MKTLETWAGRSKISYTGSVERGTKIFYGKGRSITVPGTKYKALLKHFAGYTISLGTSRDIRPPGSLGEWLGANVTKIAIASYIGSILFKEGYAKRAGGPLMEFYYLSKFKGGLR